MDNIDYKELLMKYMKHVYFCEGSYFLSNYYLAISAYLSTKDKILLKQLQGKIYE